MDRAARWPSATAVMMMRGPKATSPPAKTSGREVASVSGSVCSVPRGVSFRLSSGRIQERSAAWPMASTTVSQSTVSSLPSMNCGLNRRFSSNTRLALISSMPVTLPSLPEDAFRAEARVEPDAFLFGLLDLLAGGGDFIEVLQAVHVDLGHALADGFARHVQGQAHFVGRFRSRARSIPPAPRRPGASAARNSASLIPANFSAWRTTERADVEGHVAAADDDDFAAERDADSRG